MFKGMSVKIILKYLLYAAIFTPLIKFSNTVFPFVFAKAILFQILVSIAFSLYIFLLLRRQIAWPKHSALFWAAIIFLSGITLASAFGVDFFHSFWDVQERMTGIFNLLYYVAFLMMLLSVFETKEEGKKLARALWTMGVLLMLSGYVQVISPGFWGYEARSRIAGLLNNPIFFAMAMVWQMFLSLFLAAEEADKKKKIVYIIGALAAFYAIFLSQTRGAVIGVTAGLLIFGLGEIFTLKDKKIKVKIIIIVALACVSILLLWANRHTLFVQKLPIGYYLNISPFANTGATRLLAWKAAYQGFLERPIFGWGLNNFNIIFNKFYDPESLRYTAYETWFDRTHNVTLEFLSTTGIVGLMSYLALFAAAFWAIYKVIRRGVAPRPLLLLGASLAAYFIQNQFALDQPTSLLLFFSCLALISIYSEPKEKSTSGDVVPNLIGDPHFDGVISTPRGVIPDPDSHYQQYGKSRILDFSRDSIPAFAGTDPRSGNKIPSVMAGILVFFSIYKYNIIPLYAGYLDVVGVGTSPINYDYSAKYFKKALAINHPYRFDTVIEFTQGAIKASIAEKIIPETRVTDFKLAEAEMKNLILSHPHNTYYYYLLGRLYSEWGRHDDKYFALAETAFRAASTLSLRRQQIFFGLGEMYLFSKKYDLAEATFRHLVDLEPRVGEAHWYLGLTLDRVDKNKEAATEFSLAAQYGYVPKTQEELNFFVRLFEEQKRFKDIALIYERYIGEREPDNADLLAKEAAAWFAAGEYIKAREAVESAIKYDASLKEEAKIFLKLIEQAENKNF